MKNVVITGASRGIGFETTKLFLSDPTINVIAISRNIAPLQALAKEETVGNRLTCVAMDITNEDYSSLEIALEPFDTIDILINNAGLLINKSFKELTKSDWQQTFNVNLFGVSQLIQHLLPKLEKTAKAHIVNIGSMGGFQGSSKFNGLSAYSASKAALACFSECLASELIEFDIACNCLCLGAVNTEMLQTAFPGYKAPLNSNEMAAFLVDFSQNGHRFFNGRVLPVALGNPG